ncbi:fimbrial protein [Photorhabdus akhurstii]|uniref:PhfB n=1 Tax=Photorhabdus luminescens TaxID=29488 RepID=Q8GFC7_PHOLU|nr:fimbrial protein [Photorhabdus akhurstii]AAO17174.1 PhfB [Photorhabdus luminescens]MBS9428710.1 type 1 fimbrial protein [Photorhabdus akhurstii]
MKSYLRLLISAVLLFSINKVYAACISESTTSSGTVYFDLNSLKLNLNTSNTKSIHVARFSAEQLASSMGLNINDPIFSCDDNGYLVFGESVYPSMAGNTEHGTGKLTTGIDNLYLYFVASTGNLNNMKYPTMDGRSYIYYPPEKKKITWKDIGDIDVYLYKEGAIKSGRSLHAGIISLLQTSNGIRLITIRNKTRYHVTAQGCMALSGDQTVRFHDVYSSSFKGKGTTAGHADFNIGIECTERIEPTITFSARTINGAPESIIQLNKDNPTNTAKGVGVQILYMGTPVPIGKPFVVGHSDRNARYNLPFTARYYQTDDRITAGKANATAHFTVQYE